MDDHENTVEIQSMKSTPPKGEEAVDVDDVDDSNESSSTMNVHDAILPGMCTSWLRYIRMFLVL
jgi:hypothetical protein